MPIQAVTMSQTWVEGVYLVWLRATRKLQFLRLIQGTDFVEGQFEISKNSRLENL
jgi:hypothetical protein